MVAPLAWGWVVIGTPLDALGLTPSLKVVVIEQLIAGLYLMRVAAQARSPAERAAITRVADRLLAQARAPDSPLGALPPVLWVAPGREAVWCAPLSQSPSSCVEGRTGQLPLRPPLLHQLRPRMLQVPTILQA